jgi:hypothetical protein
MENTLISTTRVGPTNSYIIQVTAQVGIIMLDPPKGVTARPSDGEIKQISSSKIL